MEPMPAPLLELVRPTSRIEYERMVAAGVFGADRVELLFGAIVRMSPHGPPHDATLERLGRWLARAAPDEVSVRVQCAFAASDGSEPEPDLAVVPRRDYDDAHPTEARLIVEVAVSSLALDRTAKAQLYAESGVPEYWVVDVVGKAVEVHTDPSHGRYARITTYRAGQQIALSALPGLTVPVADFVR